MSNNHSLFWDSLKNVYGGSSHEETKNNLIEYVWGQMRINGEKDAPILHDLTESRFITSRRAKIRYNDMTKLKGYLNVTENGFEIILNNELKKNPRRLRTIIAHEIGHTFLYDIDSTPIRSICPLKDTQLNPWETHEGLAYEIGRNILVPKQLLKRYSYLQPSINSLFELRDLFKTTFSILARQLVQESFWDVFMFWTNFDKDIGRYQIPKKKWRFKSKKSFKNFRLNKNWSSLISHDDIKQRSIIKLRLGRTEYHLELKFTTDSNWMIGLLIPERDFN